MYKKALFVKDDKKDFVNKDEVFNFCNRCFYENKKRKAKVNVKGTEIKFIIRRKSRFNDNITKKTRRIYFFNKR